MLIKPLEHFLCHFLKIEFFFSPQYLCKKCLGGVTVQLAQLMNMIAMYASIGPCHFNLHVFFHKTIECAR